MNRVILIGNGFDLANGLKTSYKHFIDDFWNKKSELFQKAYNERKLIYQNDRSSHTNKYQDNDIIINDIDYYSNISFYSSSIKNGFERFLHTISAIDEILTKKIKFVNQFLSQITNKKTLQNWVDIEEEYYSALIDCQKNNGDIKKLNNDFQCIQDELQKYLSEQTAIEINYNNQFKEYFYSDFLKDDFNQLTSTVKLKKEDEVLFLNFNYTNIIQRYIDSDYSKKLIYIHGELQNKTNPIIFGYGDEIDDNYKLIENMKNNDYLKYIKLFHYALTNNYRNMLKFINEDEYQIYIMGLSCGTSDRILLHTLFEHKNCKSIKIFYHKENEEVDNFLDIYMNISRNFTNKEKMRELIISKEDSLPLPQGI